MARPRRIREQREQRQARAAEQQEQAAWDKAAKQAELAPPAVYQATLSRGRLKIIVEVMKINSEASGEFLCDPQFEPSGDYLLTVGDDSGRVWNVTIWTSATESRPDGKVRRVSFNPART